MMSTPQSSKRSSGANRRVVITGIGVISPFGIGAKLFWDNLVAGKIGVRRLTSFDPSGLPSQIGGEVPAFKIGEYVPKSYRKATKVMARDIELAVVAADDAFKDAGLQTKAYTDARQLLPAGSAATSAPASSAPISTNSRRPCTSPAKEISSISSAGDGTA